ncbi:MAG: hypothetical protein ACTTKH_05025 [Treponema sp.]
MKKITLFSFCFVFLFFSCGDGKDSLQDSELEIKSLTLCGKYIEPNHEIELRDINEITTHDIKATFSYSKIDGVVELPVVLKHAPILLTKDVPVKVEVYVPSKKDEYKGWKGYFNAILK